MVAPLYEDSADLYAACGSPDTAVQAEAYQVLWTYLYRVAFHVANKQTDPEALAQDCAQQALIRIHQKRETCEEPKAFRSWSRRIVSNLVIDEIRRRQRLQPLEDETDNNSQIGRKDGQSLEAQLFADLHLESLRQLLMQSPMSERSQRVVIGRYLDEVADEQLAQTESGLSEQAVRPSHVQVTRSKNINKLKKWDLLRDILQS